MGSNMDLNLFFFKTEKDLPAEYKGKLRKIIELHAKRAMRLLGVKLLNITVYPKKSAVIPETGEGGFALEGDWMQIAIDPTRKKSELDKIITEIIPSTIYHEMHHIARENCLGYGKTLLESVVSEGLADAFAEGQWPLFKAPWSQYTLKEIQPFLKQFSKEKNNKKYWHGDWFFGQGEKPRWLGYKLGSYIMDNVKEKNKKITSRKLTAYKAEKIVKISGIKI